MPVIHIENAKYDLYDRIDRRTYYKIKKYYKMICLFWYYYIAQNQSFVQ